MALPKSKTELEELRARLAEAEETLNAIRQGEVDALVVSGPQGEQIYTLHGADYSSRMLLQEMNEGALTLLADGTILYCNPRFADMLKLPHENVIGASAGQFVVSESQELFETLLRQGEEDGARAPINFSATDGTVVPAYCSVNPVKIDQTQCVSMVVTNLTEQKRHEEILASERLANSILEQAAEVIIVCDGSGTIIRASRAAREFYGRNTLYELFNDLFQIVAADGTALNCSVDEAGGRQRSTFLESCLGGTTIHALEVQLRRPDGTMADMLMSAAPLRDFQERPVGCIFTFSDISKMRDAEAALRANERQLREQSEELEQQLIASGRLVSLGEVAASMAHEFNNPLGIIMGFIEEIMTGKQPTDPDYRALQIIDEESRRCHKIVQDLMEYARPRNSEKSALSIQQVIERTLSLVENHFYKQKITHITDIQPCLPPIHADSQQLAQVLINLYLNAVDAMPGGGKLTVTARVEDGGAVIPSVVITVADSGFGIDGEELERIFKPFYTARKKRGLGLGLPICERIVKNHGGSITVESSINKGSTFKICLPVKYDST
jgi:PAS domain S-box-containing protein